MNEFDQYVHGYRRMIEQAGEPKTPRLDKSLVAFCGDWADWLHAGQRYEEASRVAALPVLAATPGLADTDKLICFDADKVSLGGGQAIGHVLQGMVMSYAIVDADYSELLRRHPVQRLQHTMAVYGHCGSEFTYTAFPDGSFFCEIVHARRRRVRSCRGVSDTILECLDKVPRKALAFAHDAIVVDDCHICTTVYSSEWIATAVAMAKDLRPAMARYRGDQTNATAHYRVALIYYVLANVLKHVADPDDAVHGHTSYFTPSTADLSDPRLGIVVRTLNSAKKLLNGDDDVVDSSTPDVVS